MNIEVRCNTFGEYYHAYKGYTFANELAICFNIPYDELRYIFISNNGSPTFINSYNRTMFFFKCESDAQNAIDDLLPYLTLRELSE